MSTYLREVEIGCSLARLAGERALRYWRKSIAVDSKSDDSPVTVADRECEQLIAHALDQQFPDDGLLGEEGTVKESRSGRRWIIDPIDGTRDFVRGHSTWANLLGLEDGGEVVAGFAFFPALEELYHASRGSGAFLDGRRIGPSDISIPNQAVVCLDGFNAVTAYPFSARLLDWMKPFWAVRSMGGAIDAMMVACGQAEVWIEPTGKPWDFAALKVISEEAGARFFNFDGGSSIYAGNCVICTPGLETESRRLVCDG